MYPNETAEHHRDHRCRNKEVNQFCYDPISKYPGNFCGYITRHHPVWAGSRSRVSRHLSLHFSIGGDEVRVRSCLIFRYRIWPKNNVYWKSIVICYKNIIRVDYCWPSPISICHLMKQGNIAKYLPVLQQIFSIVNAKELLMPNKISSLYLKNKHHICHHKKNPITFEQECTLRFYPLTPGACDFKNAIFNCVWLMHTFMTNGFTKSRFHC